MTLFRVKLAFAVMATCAATALILVPRHRAAKQRVALIEEFYRSYLSPGRTPADTGKHLPFSKSFEDLLAENQRVCSEKGQGEVCGWGADGDVYLDAQEIDPDLTFEKAGVRVEAAGDDEVRVRLNVYPSLTEHKGYYDRELIFRMVLEDGRWVVDDVLYGKDDSSRASILEENRSYGD